MTTQDESAAWLAANRPDLVNAPVVSAQQAAATNAAYQNNTLPVLPTYSLWGAPQYADYSQIPQAERAQYAQLEGSNLISGYNQVGQQTYFTPQEFQQRYGMTDVQYEQAKYNVYNNPSAVNPATLPPDLAGAYQQQIRQNQGEQPSAQFNEINRQYALQQNRVVGSEGVMYQGAPAKSKINPYGSGNALSIAWEVSGTGGATDTRLNAIAMGEAKAAGVDPGSITYATTNYITRPTFSDEYLTTKTGQTIQNKAWSGEPIRQNISLTDIMAGKGAGLSLESGIHTAEGDWGGLFLPAASKVGESSAQNRLVGGNTVAGGFTEVTGAARESAINLFVPYGDERQQAIENSKVTINQKTGEIAIYQQNSRGDWGLIGGGGRNALQSGMFSFEKAMTPWVVTQESGGSAYSRFANIPEAEKVQAYPEMFARLGAEAYGGVVRSLSPEDHLLMSVNAGDRTTDSVSRYYGSEGKYNLANFVDQVALGKAEAPGSHIHWSLADGNAAPAIQYMNDKGVIAGSGVDLKGMGIGGGNLVGGKTVGGDFSVAETPYEFSLATMPEPFISSSVGETKPAGEIFGFRIPIASDIMGLFQQGATKETKIATSVLPSSTSLVGTKTELIPESKVLKSTDVTYDAAGNQITTKNYEISGGSVVTQDFLTTGGTTRTATTITTPTKSGWDQFLEGANKFVGGITGINKLALPTLEQTKESNRFLFALTPLGVIANTPKGNPEVDAFSASAQDYAAHFVRGEAIAVKEKPAEAIVNYGIAFLGGSAWKGIEGLAGVGRAANAERIVSGGMWSYPAVASAAQSTAIKAAPVAMTAIYGASVYERSTEGGNDFSPMAAERAGTIAISETLPGGLGFMHGYAAPTKIATATRASDIGYKATLQEGGTTGRFDYYVKQPAVSAYETATTPITRAKLEFPQFMEEAGGSPVTAASRYLGYKLGMERPVIPEVVRDYYPYEGIEAAAYGKPKGIGDYLQFGKTAAPEATRNYYPYEGIEKVAYPKTEPKIVPESTRNYYPYEGIETDVYGGYEPLGMKIKAYFQENPITTLKDVGVMLRYPAKEVTWYNTNIAKPFAGIRTGTAKGTSTLNIFGRVTTPIKSSPTRAPTGIETKGKTGLTSISRVEVAPSAEVAQMPLLELGITGMPVWPSGPSPIQKQRYTIEEETEYYRLPQELVQTKPRSRTTQEITLVPDITSRFQQGISPLSKQVSAQQTQQKQESFQIQAPVRNIYTQFGQSTAGTTKQTPYRDYLSDTLRTPVSTTRTGQDIFPVVTSRRDQIVTPKQTQKQEQQQTTKQEQITKEVPWKRPFTETTLVPPPGFSLPGGGSSGGGSLKGSRKYVETLGFAYSKRGMDAFTKKTFAKKKIRGIK